jgi:hypothetical protein
MLAVAEPAAAVDGLDAVMPCLREVFYLDGLYFAPTSPSDYSSAIATFEAVAAFDRFTGRSGWYSCDSAQFK